MITIRKFIGLSILWLLLFLIYHPAFGQDIGPIRPPPEAYKKVTEDFKSQFEPLLGDAAITNYKEYKILLGNSDTALAIEISFDLIMNGAEGEISFPEIEILSKSSNRDINVNNPISYSRRIPDLYLHTTESIQGGRTNFKNKIHLEYHFPFTPTLLSYSKETYKLCLLSHGKLARILYPDKLTKFTKDLELNIKFPFKPNYQAPKYYVWGFIPTVYRNAVFELDLGPLLLKSIPKDSMLYNFSFLNSAISRINIKDELAKANYTSCSIDRETIEKQIGFISSLDCFCTAK